MASAPYEPALTLAPFRRTYSSGHEATLLADRLFTVPAHKSEEMIEDEGEALVPVVISLPNRARFDAAVARWLNDIEFDSMPDEMKDHESFGEIIADGGRVVPLIAANLRRSPSFLFLALEEIFGEDPVPEEAYGSLDTTVSAWLRWLER